MKKIIFSTILFLFSFIKLNAQSYFTANTTEMYTYNTKTEDWDLYQKNSDVEIIIVLEDEFISFQAKTPTIYKFNKDTKKSISGKNYSGYRYDAIDLKQNLKCKLDIIKYTDNLYVISIFSENFDYNLRYYVKSQ